MLEMLRELERKELLVLETNCAAFSPEVAVILETVPVLTVGVSIQHNGGQLTEAEDEGEARGEVTAAGREKGLLFLTTMACWDSPVTPDTMALCMRTCWLAGWAGRGSLSLV